MDKTIQEKIIPTPGYVLVEPLDIKQSSDIVVAEEEEFPQRGKVLAVGGKVVHKDGVVEESPCKVGDIVIHSAYGFENIRTEGVQLRMCPFDKVLGVIK